jgi:ribonuclease E
MENPQINTGDVNPLNPHTTGSNDGSSNSDYQASEAQTGGTGSNRSLPTDGPLRQNLDDEPDLTDNDNLTDDETFEDDLDTGDDDPDVIPGDDFSDDDEEGDLDDDLFDDELTLDGDSDDLNSDVDDDDLDTLDGPLLDENNPRH